MSTNHIQSVTYHVEGLYLGNWFKITTLKDRSKVKGRVETERGSGKWDEVKAYVRVVVLNPVEV